MKAKRREENVIKKRTPLIFAIAIFLFLFSNNISWAVEDTSSNNKYPDFAYEFTGRDKFERFNRKLFVFNLKLNKCVLRPINIVWASIMPKYGIDKFQNAYNNINFPVRFMSCVFQKDFKASKQEFLRFITNTTIGVGGLYDPAKNIFKLEPKQEDMSQVLAHYKCKQGPYLVLPIVRGNIRDLVGQLLDYPFKPLSYVPIAGGIATAVFSVNNTTSVQPIIKMVDDNYADPYEIARQIDGISKYIKNANLDREDVLNQQTVSQNIIKINNSMATNLKLKPDINLVNYNPQSPLIDSMRTSLFNDPSLNKSKWSKLSVWNRNFEKKIKLASIKIEVKRPDYKYRYILQKKKISPVAIIYPSFGEGINSEHSVILAKMLYDAGYSVVIQGSAFQWEFVKSMPDDYNPGLPAQDAKYLRLVTSKILNSLQKNKQCQFDKRIIVGTSFGAFTSLFVAAQEQNEELLNVSKYIAISPPIELFYALAQIDKTSQECKDDSCDVKLKTAITAEKIMKIYQKFSDKEDRTKQEYLPFTEDEAKLVISFVMRQKLSDVIFAADNCTRGKKTDVYSKINKMNFQDYAQNYIFVNSSKPSEQFDHETSLNSIAGFLEESPKYKIYHSLDDYYVNQEQLAWLKRLSNEKTSLISNGSHLGFLYRKEFQDEFKKDINQEVTLPEKQELPEKPELVEQQNIQPPKQLLPIRGL